METSYFPIRNITTYTNNWTILGKISRKSPLKPIGKQKLYFFIDIQDQHGGTIRANFWGQEAERWNKDLEEGGAYTFSRGTVNLANKKFNTLPHKYEITFNQDSKIEKSDQLKNMEVVRDYAFVTLRDIRSPARTTPFVVDILCFAKSLTPVTVLNTKFNKETKKRSLFVVDDSGYELEVTFWGDMVGAADAQTELPVFDTILDKPVILSQLTIKEWNGGRSGQANQETTVNVASYKALRNKDRLTALETWYQQVTRAQAQATTQNETFKSMRPQTTIQTRDVYEFATIDHVSAKAKGNFVFNCKLRKIFWKNKEMTYRLYYQACPNCFKKVIAEQDSSVCRCIACDDAIVTPVLRYMINCVFVDFTGQLVCSVYGDTGNPRTNAGRKLLGLTEQELDAMDKDKLRTTLDFDVLHRVRRAHPQDFKVSGFFKPDTYNGEARTRFNITTLEQIDYAKEAQALLDRMEITYESVETFLTGERSGREKRAKT